MIEKCKKCKHKFSAYEVACEKYRFGIPEEIVFGEEECNFFVDKEEIAKKRQSKRI